MYKLKNRVLSGFMAIFFGVFTSVCPVLNAQAFDISQRGVAFLVTAKSVLTAALAAAGTIAGGSYVLEQSQLTREEQVRIRNKIGALEDAYIAQQYAKADANLEMVEKTIDGIKKNFPVVVGATRDGISYVAKSFISDWYKFLNSIDFFSGKSGINISGSNAYSKPVADVHGNFLFPRTVINDTVYEEGNWYYYNAGPFFLCYDNGNYIEFPYLSKSRGFIACYRFGQSASSTNWVTTYLPIINSLDTSLPVFSDPALGFSWSKSLGASTAGILNIPSNSVALQYSFGLTNNLPVAGANDVVFPKTWVGEGINDLPFDGTTKEGLTVGAGDIPNAIPIDIGSDIPSLWEVGADVPSDVISNPADIPATGSLPWEIPDVGSIPFPIPGVAFPGAIPAEDEWPTIQDKVQTGEIASDIDVPGVGDVAIEGFPIVGNIPEEKDIEDFSDKIFPWALDKLTLPDGLFDKIPFSIPRDIYWLMQAVTAQDIGGGTGQPDPSGTGISGDVIAVDFTNSEITWRSAPHIKGKWKFPFEKLGGKDIEVPIDIDCSQYDYFAALVWYGVAIIWTIVILRSILSSFASM